MKTNKTKKRQVKGDDEIYTLTGKEYESLREAFFHAESAVRLIREHCFSNGDTTQEFIDVSNCLDMVGDQLKIMGPLLMK